MTVIHRNKSQSFLRMFYYFYLLLLNKQHKACVFRKKEQLHRQFSYVITKIIR